MGIVEEVGPDVKHIKKGDKVISSFDIGCGSCFYCRRGLFTGCATTNPSEMQASLYGQQTAGFHGKFLVVSMVTLS
jgi:threonine dehydrogenase-like Zn-dependent dehydrogenase